MSVVESLAAFQSPLVKRLGKDCSIPFSLTACCRESGCSHRLRGSTAHNYMYQCDTHSLTHLPADQEEGTWYPREKICSVRKKLQGYNSAHVMLVDFENGHGKSQ